MCSIYIPPNSSDSLAQLKSLTDQLSTPFIIMGDFKGHNPLWGSKTTNDKDTQLKDFLSQKGLCIFNNGTDTYVHPGNVEVIIVPLF